MDNNLEVYANGLRFENPFILASAPPTATGALIRRAFEAGWAGAVTKTISNDIENFNASPRLSVLMDKKVIIGLENIEMLSDKPLSYWLKEIQDIKQEYPSKILIVSIMGTEGLESWQKITRQVTEAGADALELNFSCPNGVTAQGSGAAIGQNEHAIEVITRGVKAVTHLPVIVKLTPNVTSIASAAEAAVKGGADGLCAINTVSALIGLDVETLNPLPDIGGYSTFGGLSGACVKPIGLRCVAEIAKSLENVAAQEPGGNNISIYATGGISNWKDAVEYISVGAGVVQICTEVMLRGMSIITDLTNGLDSYMKRKEINSVGEICGAALNKLTSHQALNRNYRVHAWIDESKCSLCGSCMEICSESANDSIFLNDDIIEVDSQKCSGCSLCSYICPLHAISMITG
ncbi:MAG: NAD-dependent dihydropyrimidine dehydrogenase subunit PreA [Methanococcaceae archaeon]